MTAVDSNLREIIDKVLKERGEKIGHQSKEKNTFTEKWQTNFEEKPRNSRNLKKDLKKASENPEEKKPEIEIKKHPYSICEENKFCRLKIYL